MPPLVSGRNLATHKVLDQRQLASAAATIYTVPGATQALIQRAKLVNTSGAQVTGIKLFRGGTANVNQLYPTLTLDPNAGIEYDLYLDLGTGETIAAVAGTATAITCTLSGIEITP